MTHNISSLYMARLRLRGDRLATLGVRRKLPQRGFDPGYLVHCQLRELFGEAAPTPFALIKPEGRVFTVLGYTDADEATLRDHAEAFADPAVYTALDWADGFALKQLPREWKVGRKLGFELRACPVVRLASAGPKHKKGAEVDAFLARCFREPEARHDREQVYREWLQAQLERLEGARLLRVGLEAFKRERLLRPTHRDAPRSKVVERPNVTFRGTLEVTDSAAFAALLRRGVGRHRAFGFGMMLLRPPEDRLC